jgi:hypothetical protein
LLDSFFRRADIYVNGENVTYSPTDEFPAPARRESGVVRLELDQGHAALVLVGSWGAQGEVSLLWRPPGEEAFQPIPAQNLSWLPNK